MLIKERLAIPIKEDHGTNIHWWVILGAAILVLMALYDITRQTFGLNLTQVFVELALVTIIICLPATVLVVLATAVWHALKQSSRQGALLSAIALAPFSIFMIYAHFDMSRALAPLKNEFNERVTAGGDRVGQPSLANLTKARDQYLAAYGYVRLGGWRTNGNECDCTAIYLFIGAF
ncbi:MAG: hypothetical protein PHC53_05530 [Patescibacteria group bacterium]|nr:hypothetical protein [Patescibacteria group bacterium]